MVKLNAFTIELTAILFGAAHKDCYFFLTGSAVYSLGAERVSGCPYQV